MPCFYTPWTIDDENWVLPPLQGTEMRRKMKGTGHNTIHNLTERAVLATLHSRGINITHSKKDIKLVGAVDLYETVVS